ncbi:MAG TPA: hypothetical protein VKQ08_11440 [Cyclobacteriaceae bacterium]|nr:hypothetical protein [Cyclobacteriaceae bacterium]
MRTAKSVNSIFCASLALVLFSSTISLVLASPRNYPGDESCTVSEKGTPPAGSESQLPYEERETEKDDELQDNFSCVCLISEPLCLAPVKLPHRRCEKIQTPDRVIGDIPLYLSQRVFLI